MKREIIKIDKEKCNGCGECIPACPEGAIQLIDGKARLVSDLVCDGLGACVGDCPEDAITIEKREAKPYEEEKVMENLIPQGKKVIRAHLQHLNEHGENEYLEQAEKFLQEKGIEVPEYKKGETMENQCGCPGSQAQKLKKKEQSKHKSEQQGKPDKISSKLQQWPVQLKLLNPDAPYFENADLLVSADCVPYAYGDFHRKFMEDKVVITFCPKLDQNIEKYTDKFEYLFKNRDINSVTVLNMEVPCCKGTLKIVQEAINRAEKGVPISNYTITIDGEIKI